MFRLADFTNPLTLPNVARSLFTTRPLGGSNVVAFRPAVVSAILLHLESGSWQLGRAGLDLSQLAGNFFVIPGSGAPQAVDAIRASLALGLDVYLDADAPLRFARVALAPTTFAENVEVFGISMAHGVIPAGTDLDEGEIAARSIEDAQAALALWFTEGSRFVLLAQGGERV